MSEFARFFAVAFFGVVLDLAVAYVLAQEFGVPLWLAAAAGFCVAACANYVLHQLWSFQAGPRRLSAARALRYSGAVVATLVARVAVVALLDAVLAGRWPLAVLICGAGVSFLVNYALSKNFVFAAKPAGHDAS